MKVRCRVRGCNKIGEFENGICQKCLSRMNKKRTQIKKTSNRNYPKTLRKAKELFQKLRRIQEADDNGIVVCVHGRRTHYSKCDGGHYYPAHYLNTCFCPDNVFPQEKNKNMDMHNPETQKEYRDFLIKRIGKKRLDHLDKTYRLQKKYSVIELEAMIDYYKEEIKNELKRFR